MPSAAPVTIATLPASLPMVFLPRCCSPSPSHPFDKLRGGSLPLPAGERVGVRGARLSDDLIADQRVDLLIAQARLGEHSARMGAQLRRVRAFLRPRAVHF